MELAHNVVLLRCPDSDKEFTPVSPQPSSSQDAAPSSTPVHSSRKLAPLLWCLTSCPAQGIPHFESGHSKPAGQL